VPTCAEDGYPMVPIRDVGGGRYVWGCTNPWHPRVPGPCPACGHSGHPRTPIAGASPGAVCPVCRHRWYPFAPDSATAAVALGGGPPQQLAGLHLEERPQPVEGVGMQETKSPLDRERP
jgi:hypothetical protein